MEGQNFTITSGLPTSVQNLSSAISTASLFVPGGQALDNSNTVISGLAPSRMGKPVVPMPRLT
jgi:hypothetical protein